MIECNTEICTNFDAATSREWIETNGIGGYASSTISGVNTRRYHGLLIATTKPPLGREVLLSKFEETVIIDGRRYDISGNQYPGRIYPQGFKFIKQFRLDPFPVWIYDLDGVQIAKSVFMVHGENTTVSRWEIISQSEISNLKSENKGDQFQISNFKFEIELRPLIAFRDHHHLRHEDKNLDRRFETGEDLISIKPFAESTTLYFAHNGATVEATGNWYRNFEYEIERERGFDFYEDLFQPFSFRFDLSNCACVIVSTEPKQVDDCDELEKSEIARRTKLVVASKAVDDFSKQLVLAADQFIVSRGSGKTVIAGYPWFSDWGRDTMIALNGLTLATNRPEIAKSILLEFSRHISEGMLPNRFPDEGETPEYNTVDATLWFFEAIRAYAQHTQDFDFVRDELYAKLVDIIGWHIRGTRYRIHVDTDGLLYAGEPGVQLTWMDAKIGAWVVTPRTGKPVEIQALWYNALRIMAEFAPLCGDNKGDDEYTKMAEIVRESFNGQFWNEPEQCLFDVIEGDTKDASIRPNQIFAVSLPHTMLDDEKANKIVERVERDLLTPAGLRSLSPQDERYEPVYLGSPHQRDSSYHQGTVWGWLMGHFVDAYRKVHPQNAETKNRVTEIISHLNDHLGELALGQVSEIFDGEAPHTPRGCPAQAWSVAELLRITAK